MEGNVVYLTSLQSETKTEASDRSQQNPSEISDDPMTSAIEAFGQLVGKEDAEKLRIFAEEHDQEERDPWIRIGPINDKNKRTVTMSLKSICKMALFRKCMRFVASDLRVCLHWQQKPIKMSKREILSFELLLHRSLPKR